MSTLILERRYDIPNLYDIGYTTLCGDEMLIDGIGAGTASIISDLLG